MKLYWFRNLVQYFPSWDTWNWHDTRQRYGNGHLEIRKMKIIEANLFNTVGCCIYKKTMVKFVIFYILYKYNSNISHNKTTGLRNSFNNLNVNYM
jgi:hypothetical protein